MLSDSLVLPAFPQGGALLMLTREQFVRINPLPAEELTLDGEPIGLLPQRSWFALAVAGGPHELSGPLEGPRLRFDVLAGHRYLARLREVLEDNDRLRQEWLLDDPGSFHAAVKSSRIRRACTTSEGFAYLRRRTDAHPSRGTRSAAAAAARRVELAGILNESPLDPVNLEHDFELKSGGLVIDSSSVRYSSSGQSLTIPIEDIVRVRFGGTRFSNQISWIDVMYLGSTGNPLLESFADSNPATGVATYNLLFLTLDALGPGRPGLIPPGAIEVRPAR
ncbi:MAG: hypothetical protein HYR73_04325 [Candidatus Eisenbacteria bacterium]|nr:hypothetical protein [Candidatus Eisenbacteria bacterium]